MKKGGFLKKRKSELFLGGKIWNKGRLSLSLAWGSIGVYPSFLKGEMAAIPGGTTMFGIMEKKQNQILKIDYFKVQIFLLLMLRTFF